MKKLFIAILLTSAIWSCKKENIQPSATSSAPSLAVTHNIKYEAIGQCCYMEVTFDGTTMQFHSQFNWDYSFTALSGQSLSLSAYSTVGANYQTQRVTIYIDGVSDKVAQGYGVQSVTSIVP